MGALFCGVVSYCHIKGEKKNAKAHTCNKSRAVILSAAFLTKHLATKSLNSGDHSFG